MGIYGGGLEEEKGESTRALKASLHFQSRKIGGSLPFSLLCPQVTLSHQSEGNSAPQRRPHLYAAFSPRAMPNSLASEDRNWEIRHRLGRLNRESHRLCALSAGKLASEASSSGEQGASFSGCKECVFNQDGQVMCA